MHTQLLHLSVSLSSRYTDQGGKSSEGFFLMGHSTSVVALAAHPLGQHVLTAQKPQRKKMAMMEKGTKQTKLSLTFNTRYKCKL